MIKHVIAEKPRQWHLIIPFVVWALREVPNATTGISPHELVYGTTPRGSLTFLKEIWADEIELPTNIGREPIIYLKKLKENICKFQRLSSVEICR